MASAHNISLAPVPSISKKSKKRVKNTKKQVCEISVQTDALLVENPELKYRARMIENLISTFIDNGLIIFGSYVREYMCDRTFDHLSSDIDVFSGDLNLGKIGVILRNHGFTMIVNKNSKSSERYGIHKKNFKVHHLSIGLINAEFFIGTKIDVMVDFVHTVNQSTSPSNSPPFNCLDFECNSLIWDKHGIRLSRNTGTFIDSLSAKEIKQHEQRIIEDAKNKVAIYIPTSKLPNPPTGINPQAIYFRKMRAKRIVKLLRQEWNIQNFNDFVEVKAGTDDTCTICGDQLKDYCMKLSCKCDSKFDHDCFIKFAHSQLDETTFIRCPQRCGDIYL